MHAIMTQPILYCYIASLNPESKCVDTALQHITRDDVEKYQHLFINLTLWLKLLLF